MAASFDRREVISASSFCRSTLMSVAPAALFTLPGRSRASALPEKAIGPGKPMPGPMMTNARRRGVGKAGIDRRDKDHKPEVSVGPTNDIAGDNLELWRGCQPRSAVQKRCAPTSHFRRCQFKGWTLCVRSGRPSV